MTTTARSFYATESRPGHGTALIALRTKAARDAWVAGDAGSPNARRAAVTRQEAEGVIGGRFNLEQLGVGDLTPCAG
jgi:hypothetical protein